MTKVLVTNVVGSTGASAYQIAVIQGFTGTESEWLDSLVGPPGTNAVSVGGDLALSPGGLAPYVPSNNRIALAFSGSGVISGCLVSQHTTPNMSVDVAVGSILSAGAQVSVASANPSVTAAHATLVRYDLVSVSSAGVVAVTAGTPAASPVWPTAPGGNVVLAAIRVSAAASSIVSADLADLRLSLPSRTISSALPTASATYRGRIMTVEGGAGVADVSYICLKNASDAYTWKTFTLT